MFTGNSKNSNLLRNEDSMTQAIATQRSSEQADAIRPFPKVNVPEAELAELRRRINATRWPERETVTDASQGVQLETTQALARYWATDYDWRKCESRLNALPQFITEIDGLDIHFIHVRSKHENALPIIVTHGWPGSVVEQLKFIDPLTNPTAHGRFQSIHSYGHRFSIHEYFEKSASLHTGPLKSTHQRMMAGTGGA
jgi:hypothetical protein